LINFGFILELNEWAVSRGIMIFNELLLLIPEKSDTERNAVAEVWQAQGGEVLPLGRFWAPPALNHSRVRLYGNDTFCLVLAQKLELELLSPPDDLLLQVNPLWLKRKVELYSLAQAFQLDYPQFIKPLIPKQFRAAIYSQPEELSKECEGLGVETQVLVSEIVEFTAEARAFLLDGRIETCAVYEGEAEVKEAFAFVSGFAQANQLPKTCVIDVGYQPSKGWALVEANATWGAGLNGCDPFGAARCIAWATMGS
jgi:hypothetical protein